MRVCTRRYPNSDVEVWLSLNHTSAHSVRVASRQQPRQSYTHTHTHTQHAHAGIEFMCFISINKMEKHISLHTHTHTHTHTRARTHAHTHTHNHPTDSTNNYHRYHGSTIATGLKKSFTHAPRWMLVCTPSATGSWSSFEHCRGQWVWVGGNLWVCGVCVCVCVWLGGWRESQREAVPVGFGRGH